MRYALTGGELARMMVSEEWIDHAESVDLTVIPSRGWTRAMHYEETGLPWQLPSPNLRDAEAALAYTGTCFFEGVNVSEGRGTDAPFLIIGAPYIDSEQWATALADCELPGVAFEPQTFTPQPNAGASRPKLNGTECHGVRLRITDNAAFRPVRTGLAMLTTIAQLWPEEFEIRESHFDRLWGTSSVRAFLEGVKAGERTDWQAIADSWQTEDDEFWSRAAPYLMYE